MTDQVHPDNLSDFGRETGIGRRDLYLAMLAHELRTPLAPISNGLGLLQDSCQLDDVGQRVHDIVERQVAQMLLLIDDLLEISRTDTVDVGTTVSDLRDIIGSAIETAQPALDLVVHPLAVELPGHPLLVRGDAKRLSRIFSNLLINACRYATVAGRIRLVVTRPDGFAQIQVLDDGPGIPVDLLGRIFEPFIQVPGEGDVEPVGAGLGLAVVRQIVESHGGTARAESDGSGSTFTIRLPLMPDTPQV